MADEQPRSEPARAVLSFLQRFARRLGGWSPVVGRRRSFPTTPRSFEDAEGRPIDLRGYDDGAFEALVDMYDDFDPARRAQGTPPVGEAAVREWLESVLGGTSVVAWHGDRAVGHVTFVPDGTDRHELAIFVHQDYQRAGIGTTLLLTGLGHARESNVGYVWLTVEQNKRGAQKLYSDVGFSTVNPMGPVHRMSMSL